MIYFFFIIIDTNSGIPCSLNTAVLNHKRNSCMEISSHTLFPSLGFLFSYIIVSTLLQKVLIYYFNTLNLIKSNTSTLENVVQVLIQYY